MSKVANNICITETIEVDDYSNEDDIIFMDLVTPEQKARMREILKERESGNGGY